MRYSNYNLYALFSVGTLYTVLALNKTRKSNYLIINSRQTDEWKKNSGRVRYQGHTNFYSVFRRFRKWGYSLGKCAIFLNIVLWLKITINTVTDNIIAFYIWLHSSTLQAFSDTTTVTTSESRTFAVTFVYVNTYEVEHNIVITSYL